MAFEIWNKKGSKVQKNLLPFLLLYNYIIIRSIQIRNDQLENNLRESIHFYFRTTLVAPAPPRHSLLVSK